jgi:uncharacterized membrane protein
MLSCMSFSRIGRWIDQLQVGMRLILALLVAVIALALTGTWLELGQRLLFAWDVGITTYLLLLLKMIVSVNSLQTQRRAQVGEPNALTILMLVVFTAIASIVATGLLLADTKIPNNPLLALQVSLATWAVIAAWFLTHTCFALQYARYYYDDNYHTVNEFGYAGGLDFPGDGEPDYLDFMYFSFTISLTSQTSDVSIEGRHIRRLVLFHQIISFFFYSVIVGLVINVIADLW